MDNPAKVNDLEIALWAFKNVQNFFGSTIKTFQLKNQHKPSCKSEFPFCCCCCYWNYLHRTFSFYVFLVSLKYLKTYGNDLNLSIIHFWLIKHVLRLCLYMHMLLPLKKGVCCIYAYSLFVWDSSDIRGLYFSNFSSEKYLS